MADAFRPTGGVADGSCQPCVASVSAVLRRKVPFGPAAPEGDLPSMSTLFYSMSGEGRGHATRTRAIVEDLRRRHRVVLFAPRQAHDLLAPLYEGTDVEVRRIEGLAFHYREGGGMDHLRTALEFLRALRRFPALVDSLRQAIRAERPDLVVTDFEPLLPRAAAKEGVPYVSVDHQHFLTTYSMRGLSARLRLQAFLMGLVVRLFHGRQKLTVVSSFYRPPLKRGLSGKVRQVGVLLGDDVRGREAVDGDFLLVYLRRDTPRRVFRALAACGAPCRVYGPGRTGIEGNLTFLPVDRAAFVADLARCRALVATAGNQVVGEAMHLGKPVLVLPEAGNWEQAINAHWVERMGIGASVPPRTLRSAAIRDFLGRLDGFKAAMPAPGAEGNDEVARALEEVLAGLREPKSVAWFPRFPARAPLRQVA